jgi:hypothetical protein
MRRSWGNRRLRPGAATPASPQSPYRCRRR